MPETRSRESESVECPRCDGAGSLEEPSVVRKTAAGFEWVTKRLACHLCSGRGRTSARAAGKWGRSNG